MAGLIICGKCEQPKHPGAFQPSQIKKQDSEAKYCRDCLKKPRSTNPDPKGTFRRTHNGFFASS